MRETKLKEKVNPKLKNRVRFKGTRLHSKRINNATLVIIKKGGRIKMENITPIKVNNIMSFEEFCEPFKETAKALLKNGITPEQLKINVQKRRREFYERNSRY